MSHTHSIPAQSFDHAKQASTSLRLLGRRVWKYRWLYVFMLPALIYFLIYRYLPFVGITIAFKDFSILDGINASPWAEPLTKNFETLFRSPYFAQVFVNTLIISFLKISFGLLPPLILSILISECPIPWFRRSIQTISYMPHFLSWVIIYGMMILLFSQTNGLVNRLVVDQGGSPVPFLTSPDYFRQLLIGSEVWKDMGWGAIIYLAAMANIDPTLYEAARVDGASRLSLIRHITLPGVRSVFVLLLILRVGSIMEAGFEQVYVLYNPQVYSVADIIDTWVYRTGLQQLNFSLATAVGLFKSTIGFVLILATNQLAKRWGEGIW